MTCCAVPDLREELAALPPLGREALLLSRMTRLAGSCDRHGSDLLCDLVLADAESPHRVAPTTLEQVVGVMPLSAVQAAVGILDGCSVYVFSYLLARLPARALLGRITEVRDGSVPYLNTLDGIVGLAFDLASGMDRSSRQCTPSRLASDTILLIGAARDPQWFCRDLLRVRVIQNVLLSQDAELLTWALGNPGLDESTRAYLVGLAAASVIVELHALGVLGRTDLISWTGARAQTADTAQLLSAFLVEGPRESCQALARTVLSVVDAPLEIIRGLPAGGRDRALESLGAGFSGSLFETFSGLLDGWSGSLPELVEASRNLTA
jgi:hypothetical protein